MQTIDTKMDIVLDDPVDEAKSSADTEVESLPHPLDDPDTDSTTAGAVSNKLSGQSSSKYPSEPGTEPATGASSSAKKQISKKRDKKLNRWPRAFARMLDLAWEISLVVGLLTYFVNSASVDSGFGSPVFYLMLFVSLPIALLLDAIIAGLFGNTPFKAIIGVKAVTARGERLSLVKHIRRNIGVWTDGLGMGVLPMSLFTLTQQFKRVSGRREAIYDERLHARSHSSEYVGLRLLSLVLVTLGAVVGLGTYVHLTQKAPAEKQANEQIIENDPLAAIAQTESLVEQNETPEPTNINSSEGTSVANSELESSDPSKGTSDTSVPESDELVENTTEPSESAGNEIQAPQVTSGALRQWTNPVSNLQSEIPQRFASISSTDALAMFRDLSTGAEVTLEKITNATNGVNEQTASRLIKEKFNHIDFDDQIVSFPLGEWSIHEMQGQDGSTQARASAQPVTIEDIDRLKAAIWSTLPTP